MKEALATQPAGLPQTTLQEVIGIDLGDRWSRFCVLDQAGNVKEEARVPTTSAGFAATFGTRQRSWMVIEVGGSEKRGRLQRSVIRECA
jgi:hypothetical protein